MATLVVANIAGCHGLQPLSCSLQPAYGSAFAARTCGYLVLREGAGAGTLPRGKGQRLWCVLDGSTLLCYGDEEVSEGCWNNVGLTTNS